MGQVRSLFMTLESCRLHLLHSRLGERHNTRGPKNRTAPAEGRASPGLHSQSPALRFWRAAPQGVRGQETGIFGVTVGCGLWPFAGSQSLGRGRAHQLHLGLWAECSALHFSGPCSEGASPPRGEKAEPSGLLSAGWGLANLAPRWLSLSGRAASDAPWMTFQIRTLQEQLENGPNTQLARLQQENSILRDALNQATSQVESK